MNHHVAHLFVEQVRLGAELQDGSAALAALTRVLDVVDRETVLRTDVGLLPDWQFNRAVDRVRAEMHCLYWQLQDLTHKRIQLWKRMKSDSGGSSAGPLIFITTTGAQLP